MESSYATVVSTFAALASIGSLIIHWIRWNHDQRTKSLIVKLNLEDNADDIGDWKTAKLTLRSRSNTGYTAKNIRALWPISVKLAWYSELYTKPREHAWEGNDFAEPENATNSLAANLVVTHAGQKGAFHPEAHFRTAYGDKESATFYIKRPGVGRVLIRINIEPEDDTERSFQRYRWIDL